MTTFHSHRILRKYLQYIFTLISGLNSIYTVHALAKYTYMYMISCLCNLPSYPRPQQTRLLHTWRDQGSVVGDDGQSRPKDPKRTWPLSRARSLYGYVVHTMSEHSRGFRPGLAWVLGRGCVISLLHSNRGRVGIIIIILYLWKPM